MKENNYRELVLSFAILTLISLACVPKQSVSPTPYPCSSPFSVDQAIFLKYPKEWQVFQMDAYHFGHIPIFGMYKEEYTGGIVPTGIEAQWGDFSPWILIDESPDTTTRTFEGVIPNQDALLGRQTVHIRFSNAPDITFSVPNVGIGLVVVGEGQSNMVGAMSGIFRSFLGGSRLGFFTNPLDPHSIGPATDPLNGCAISGMGGGSFNPELLDRLSLSNQGVPVMYVSAAVNGSQILQFQPGNQQVFEPILNNLRIATAEGASCPIFRYRLQGESEVLGQMLTEEYKNWYLSYEDALQDFFLNELGCPAPVPVVLGVIGATELAGNWGTFEDAEQIRNALRELSGERPQIFAGPETTLCPMSSGVHFNTDAKECLINLWCEAIDASGITNCH